MDERRRTELFFVGLDEFTDLEIRPSGDRSGFNYFFDVKQRRLIKEFVIDETDRTITYCEVTLIAKGEKFEPRLFLKKDNKTKAGFKRGQEQLRNQEEHILVKTAVNLDPCHENFWQLVSFLAALKEVEFPGEPVAVVPQDLRDLTSVLADADTSEARRVVQSAMRGRLTEADVRLLVDRRAALDEFNHLIEDPDYLAARIEQTGARGEEPMWQAFFEEHPWIFGYGLKLVACEGFDDTKLEQYTTGADAFSRTGDRIDGLMITLGLIQSLMFVEIKKASEDLLNPKEYRSGIYRPSAELSGAVSQVQVTAHRAVKGLSDLATQKDRKGWPLREVGTVEPRKVIVIGQLQQFSRNGVVNEDLYRSFELYRRSIHDVEIITFDELLERARFIARHETADGSTDAGGG
ncbi:MAG: DUF4263 domain-containing protein [Actinobacteria bacterium]|nr:DUF4263 domain-containing protein [Actinomycetota bacterium]